MKIFVCNALAIGMLSREVQSRTAAERAVVGSPRCPRPITLEAARGLIAAATEVIGAVGHADTARLIADALGLDVSRAHARITVRLQGGPEGSEFALIGAYVGPRLAEGATTLPEGATIEWWIV